MLFCTEDDYIANALYIRGTLIFSIAAVVHVAIGHFFCQLQQIPEPTTAH
jgi:hypothetical protein